MPKSVANDNREQELLAYCDATAELAAAQMQTAGASTAMVIDRLLTFGAAMACLQRGSPDTAAAFRLLADNIEAGCFHSITGEGARN